MLIYIMSLLVIVFFFLKSAADSYSSKHVMRIVIEAEEILLRSTNLSKNFKFAALDSSGNSVMNESLLSVIKKASLSGVPFVDSLVLYKKNLEIIALSFDKLRRMYSLLIFKFLLLGLPIIALRLWVHSGDGEDSSLIRYDCILLFLAALIYLILIYVLKRFRVSWPLLICDLAAATKKRNKIDQKRFSWLTSHLYATNVSPSPSVWSLEDLDREELKNGRSLKNLKRQRLELAVQKDNQAFEYAIDRFADSLPLIEILGFGFPALLLSIVPLIKLLGISE